MNVVSSGGCLSSHFYLFIYFLKRNALITVWLQSNPLLLSKENLGCCKLNLIIGIFTFIWCPSHWTSAITWRLFALLIEVTHTHTHTQSRADSRLSVADQCYVSTAGAQCPHVKWVAAASKQGPTAEALSGFRTGAAAVSQIIDQ